MHTSNGSFARSRRLGVPAAVISAALLAASGCKDAAPPASLPQTGSATDAKADAELRDRIDKALDFTLNHRPLDVKTNAGWQVVHGALAFGRDFKVIVEGKETGALDYLLGGGALAGWNLRPGDHGLEALLEEGTKTGQGHEDQWLGYLSQVGLKPSDPIVVGGKSYTITDMISQAQWDIYEGMEATWTLMAFSTFLPLDTKWKSKDGSEWTIERMVAMEAAQDLNTSACGGSHRLYGLTVARNQFRETKQPFTGGWAAADKKIREAAETARKFQQPDGSFSAHYFERPGSTAVVTDRIGTTGHTLEFLTVALSDDELAQPWVAKAASHLVSLFEATQETDLECGALFHAAHGLKLYRERRFGPRKSADPVADN